MSDEIHGSRLRRAARMTGTAAGVGAREMTARALSKGDSDKRRAQAQRQQLKNAEALVKMFSGMRGAAMKVGQTLSAVDLGLVPEEVRPQFQEILATLQQDAEPVSFKAIRKVIESDLEEKLTDAFATFEEEPFAAASIGQVHRATLHDGRRVAVKVQYPGIAEAIHADMQNLRLGLKLLSAIAPGIDTGSIAGEIKERIGEELDYELEASNHRAMARKYKGHPFIFVPDVITDLCRERMIVTEYVDGKRLSEVVDAPQEVRDRYGEILCRFYINGPLRHRLMNGDPHPGNSIFLDDGRVAFIDFGFFKRMGDVEVRQMIESTQALHREDPEGLFAIMRELGALPDDPALVQPFYENYRSIFGWCLEDEVAQVDSRNTAKMMRNYTDMRSGEGGFDQLTLPAEHFVMMRAVFLLIGLLGSLQASNNWFDLAREWLLDDAPVTELGRQEEAFFGPRPNVAAPIAA